MSGKRTVLFINPVIDGKPGATPPLGMLFVMSYVRQRFDDFEFVYRDFNVERLDAAAQARVLQELNPCIVGIYTCTNYLNCAVAAARTVKQALPGCAVVFGGHHVTARPDDEYPDADCIVAGEGEEAFADLLRLVREGRPLPRVHRASKLVEDINFRPAWDQIADLRPYDPVGVFFQYKPQAWVTGGRGCPFDCFFCASVVYRDCAPRVRLREPDQVIEEIVFLKERFGIKGVFFTDDEINARPEWLEAICDRLIASRTGLAWCGQFRTNQLLLPERLVRKMRQAGCYGGCLGLESGNDQVLRHLRKHSNVANNWRALELFKKYGILAHGSFLIANAWPGKDGRPQGESMEQIGQTRDFIRKAVGKGLLPSVSVSIATPYPGSGLDALLREYGLLLEPDYTKWDLDGVMRQRLMFRHPCLSEAEVQRAHQEIWESLATSPALILQRLKMIRSLEDVYNFARNGAYVLGKVLRGKTRLRKAGGSK